MKKNKKIILIALAVIVCLAIVALIIANSINNKNELTLNEKKWIDENKNSMIDIYVMNNLPLFTDSKDDIFLSFLDYFEAETGLTLNKVSYSLTSDTPTSDYLFKIINETDDIGRNDLLFYEDEFVIISKNESGIQSFSDLEGKKVGALTSNITSITEYISSEASLSFTNYDDDTQLFNAISSDEVDYIIIPKNRYLKEIVSNSYFVVDNLSNLSNKYVLSLSQNNTKLNSIFTKLFNKWYETNFDKLYLEDLNDYYFRISDIDDKAKTSFLGKKYIYGYVENSPYDISSNRGINLEFLKGFEDFSGVEFQFKKYSSAKALLKAYENGDVDVIFNYYGFDSSSSNKTINVYDSGYVLLSNIKNITTVDSYTSLSGKTIYSIKDTALTNYINNNSKATVKTVSKFNNLFKDDSALVLLDINVYNYYKNTKLRNYYSVYQGKTNLEYNFLIKRDDTNNLFANVFEYYLSNINKTEYVYRGIINSMKGNIFEGISLFYYFIALVFIVLAFAVTHKIKELKNKNNEEKSKFMDPLTSLKNRNYLNANISKWDENKVYPQAIIVIDLNNLKKINSELGYQEGDEVIKAAANILIKNQLKNTDIIRTDGNEFMIYMVGYDEDQVVLYMRKIYKLMKDLPHNYGATLGHSMILNDIKLLDDAINDAIIEVKDSKESKEKGK